MDTTTAPLTDEELAKVAVGRYERLTVDQVAELLDAPAGQRPRLYALWHGQIVSVPSTHYLDQYRDEARAWWVSGNTLADLIHRA